MWLLLFLTAATAIAGEFATSFFGTYPFVVSAVTTDSSGNTYVVGSRRFVNDVFLSKLDPNGGILFTDTFGGSGTDSGTAVTVDAPGNIYIAGTAGSTNFPVSHALQAQPGVGGSGFVMKISNDGATIFYSTYFGGTQGASSISWLATDGKGNLYVTGNTSSSDFPQTSELPTVQFTSSNGALASGTIVAEISAAGDKILYSGLILTGPNDNVNGRTGIAVDAAGNAYIAGNTANPNLPVSSPSVPARTNGGPFVAKVNAGGAGFGYLTYIPGSTSVSAVAVNAAGNAYIAGYNQSAPNESFPTTPGSLQPTLNGEFSDGFLAELSPTGSAFVWATYLPGSCGAWPLSIAVDAGGTVWSTGTGADNCTVPNINGWSNGPEFLFGVSADGSRLAYSALYPSGTVAESVVVDSSGVVHVGGSAGFVSAVAPGAPLATEIFGFQNAFGGSLTAQISPGELIAIYGPGIGPALAVTAAPTNGFYPTALGGVQAAINGVNVPLLYVSDNQVNAVAPMELPSNAAATVQVINGTTASANYPVWVVPAAPVANPVVLNQDGTLNSEANPAHGGSIVTFWVTGWQSNFPLADGQVQSAPNNDACLGGCQADANFIPVPICVGFCGLAEPAKPVKKVVGSEISVAATVAYAGAAPGFAVGVTQFNVQLGSLPASAGTNLFGLAVTSSSTGSIVGEGVYIAP
jgi:uncharacterized protein (TIGR03437 family)